MKLACEFSKSMVLWRWWCFVHRSSRTSMTTNSVLSWQWRRKLRVRGVRTYRRKTKKKKRKKETKIWPSIVLLLLSGVWCCLLADLFYFFVLFWVLKKLGCHRAVSEVSLVLFISFWWERRGRDNVKLENTKDNKENKKNQNEKWSQSFILKLVDLTI